jgi:hypothetical protein
MADSNIKRTEHLFIVRLWSESRNPDRPEWRGSVEHATCKHKLYFIRLADMQDFITFHLCDKPVHLDDEADPFQSSFDTDQEG